MSGHNRVEYSGLDLRGPGDRKNIRIPSDRYGQLKLGRPVGRLNFDMGLPIPARRNPDIVTLPWSGLL